MKDLPFPLSPDRWMAQIFTARTAAEGGVVRRRLSDIDRLVGRDRFIAEVQRRGFRAIENAGHVIIICNRDPVRRLA